MQINVYPFIYLFIWGEEIKYFIIEINYYCHYFSKNFFSFGKVGKKSKQ